MRVSIFGSEEGENKERGACLIFQERREGGKNGGKKGRREGRKEGGKEGRREGK